MKIVRGSITGCCLLAFLFGFSTSLFSTTSVQAHVLEDTTYSRQDLLQRYYAERKLIVVFGASSPHMEEQMRRTIESSRWRWRSEQQIYRADEVLPADLAQSAVLLVGTPDTNPLLKKLPSSFPIAFKSDGFSFFGKLYQQGDAFTILQPSPYNSAYPLFVVSSWDESAVLGALDDRMREYDYLISRRGNTLRMGRFSQEPASLWQLEEKWDLDYERSTRLVGNTDHFKFYANGSNIDHGRLAEIIRLREANLQRVLAFAQDQAPEEINTFNYFLYGTLQDKAVITKSMQFAHLDYNEAAVHVGIEDGIAGDALNKETMLVVRSIFGAPAIQALEDGLAIYLSDSWFDQPVNHWFDRIAHSGQYYSLNQLLDNNRYAASSPLVREVLAGAMVSCMIEEWGRDNLLENYADWQPTSEEWAGLNHMWRSCIAAGKARFQQPQQKAKPADGAFQKGFNFAHEGYGIVNGYGSVAADEAQDKLKKMGASAVSIIPYTFMRDPTRPVPLRLPNTAGDENDGAVAHAARYAQSIGFQTMVKPQIWLRGSWPGDIEMQTPEDWDAFYEHYAQWITHYALLSEIFEVDILCIGTELTKATMHNEAWWAAFATSMRSIYSGQLVYAPNWGEEFESLSFWDAFDYIGVNSYYPLSDLDNPSDEDLLAGAKEVAKRMEAVHKQYKKSIIITEIGYPNSPAPWKLPYQEQRRAEARPMEQARCYKAMSEALVGRKWLQGIYWWKWPSYLDRGGPDHRGFTPNNKPAEQVVAQWYQSF